MNYVCAMPNLTTSPMMMRVGPLTFGGFDGSGQIAQRGLDLALLRQGGALDQQRRGLRVHALGDELFHYFRQAPAGPCRPRGFGGG